MRGFLVLLIVSLSTLAHAQSVRRAGGSAPPPHQVPKVTPTHPPPPPMLPQSVSPPIVMPFPSLMPPPTGGLTPGVTFTPPVLATTPVDVFRAGGRTFIPSRRSRGGVGFYAYPI